MKNKNQLFPENFQFRFCFFLAIFLASRGASVENASEVLKCFQGTNNNNKNKTKKKPKMKMKMGRKWEGK